MKVTLPTFGALLLALMLVTAGCGGDEAASATTGTIPEQTFVTVMAELHHAMGSALDGELSPAVRDEILARHGIEADGLIHFAQVLGGDIPAMLRIWQEVAQQSRLLDAPDTAAEPGRLP